VRKPERVGAPRLSDLVIGKVGPTKHAVPPPLTVHAARSQRTLVGPVAPPGEGNKQPPVDLGTLEPLPAPELDSTPIPGAPRSLSPPPMASPAEERAIGRAAREHGDRVVRAPESAPAPTVAPRMLWWHTAEGVSHVVGNVMKGLGALLVTALGALATYRATAPAPPPPPVPPEVNCPHWSDSEAKRGPLCQRIHDLELSTNSTSASLGTVKTAVGDLQRATSELGKRVPEVKSEQK
jgi:hypothetical protein